MVGGDTSAVIKVLIMGGLLTLEEALQRALETAAAGISVIGIGHDLAEAERLLAEARSDVILVCGAADNSTGALVEQMVGRHPDARVVVLAPDVDDESLQTFVTAGAFGLVNVRLEGFDELVSTLHRAAAGESLLSADTLRRIIRQQRIEVVRQRQRADVIRRLTERELEVLGLVGCGLDNGTVAEKLYLSVTTVRSHVQHLLAKLGLHSRLEAAVLANQYGLASGAAQGSATHELGPSPLAASRLMRHSSSKNPSMTSVWSARATSS